MEKESLREIFEKIVPPELTDEIMEKILNNFSSKYFYNSIQHINGFDKKESTNISQEDEKKIRQNY